MSHTLAKESLTKTQQRALAYQKAQEWLITQRRLQLQQNQSTLLERKKRSVIVQNARKKALIHKYQSLILAISNKYPSSSTKRSKSDILTVARLKAQIYSLSRGIVN